MRRPGAKGLLAEGLVRDHRMHELRELLVRGHQRLADGAEGLGVPFTSHDSIRNEIALGYIEEARVAGLELRRDYVLVAAAGPASNLLLALAAAIVLRMVPVSPVMLGEPNVSAPIASLLTRAIQLNVILAVFNMLPIPPLDGGNVIGGLLPRRFASAFNSVRPYGFLILYALMLTGRLEYFIVPPSRLLVSWLQ